MLCKALSRCICCRNDFVDVADQHEVVQSSTTEAEDRREQSEAWRTAKAGFVGALEVAEKALDGVPIPGVKGSIGGIVSILKSIDVC